MTAPEIIAGICRDVGPQIVLHPDSTLERDRVLWALAGCESDFGQYALLRHEPAYCYDGRYWSATLSKRYGCLAHCSFGPWQMMYPHLVTFSGLGSTPALNFVAQPGDVKDPQFAPAARRCAEIAAVMLTSQIFGRQKAMTLAHVAKAWNHGCWDDDFNDDEYINRAMRFYNTPYPKESR